MALKQQALSGFKRMTDDRIATAVSTIIQAMTGNEHFPDPVPTLDVVQTALDDYSLKLATAAKRGSPEDTALKNESKAALALLMKQLSVYVTTAAGETLSVLLSSGFPVSSYPTIGKPPLVVEDIKLIDGRQSGQLQLLFSSQRNVLLYEYQYTQEKNALGEPLWGDIYRTSSSRDNLIQAMPFTRCYVRVRSVNRHGESEWSETVSHIGR